MYFESSNKWWVARIESFSWSSIHTNVLCFFQEILDQIGPSITKKTTSFRKPIQPEVKLAVTLRFFASGDSFESLMFTYRVHSTTIAQFVPIVSEAIIVKISHKFLKIPRTKEEWTDLAKKTYNRWQFPNCFGAIDGKHVTLRHPQNSGAMYFNYKSTFSIVMMVMVDYHYIFVYVTLDAKERLVTVVFSKIPTSTVR